MVGRQFLAESRECATRQMAVSAGFAAAVQFQPTGRSASSQTDTVVRKPQDSWIALLRGLGRVERDCARHCYRRQRRPWGGRGRRYGDI